LLDDFGTMNLKTPALGEVASDGHFMTEARWLANIPAAERNAYTWSNTQAYLAIEDWDLSYKRVFQCNLVLDGLKKLSPSSNPEKYNRIRGNALFHRAKNYFDLAQIYAQPYKLNSALSDLGIPLKEGIDVTELSTRSSVKSTYEQILADLKTSIGLLPSLPSVKSRGSASAACALLARTYLIMGDYSNALIYSDSSLNQYSTLMDFNLISSSLTNLGIFNSETLFYSQRSNKYTSITTLSFYGVDPDLYALYHNNDLRRTRFFTTNAGRIVFKGNYTNSTVGFTGLAVDEQYLIRAECLARAGNITQAMDDLNFLLKSRWNNTVTYPIKTAINTEDALNQILVERKKELLFRTLRWMDLRRLNLDSRFKVTLTRTIGGVTYTLEPESYRYTFPIPADVLNLAPNLQQTPGW